MSAPPAQPQDAKLLDRLLSVRSAGTGNAFESSPDGRWLFVAESGSLAVIQAPTVAEYHQPRSLVPLGEEGVIAADLMLDPAARAPYGNDPADLLYVAAGRSGLWAIEANTAPGLAALDAGRIDDATVSGGTQDSRRWCDDLDAVRLELASGERTFLVALFGAKDDSRLRLYDVERARTVVRAHESETGHEIACDLEVVIGRHPLYPTWVPRADDSRSFAFAMTTDRIGPTETAVYVALGEHGLARVRLTSAMLEPDGEPPLVEWGPVFGAASEYAATNPLYGDLRYVQQGTGIVDQVDLPVFADVAVQRNVWGRFLYAAVDHLGWARFDLDGAWSSTMPIEHQEGRTVTNAVGQKQTSLVAAVPSESGHTFARRITLLLRGEEVIVAVSAASGPMRTGADARNDGQVLNSDFLGVNGVDPAALMPLAGERRYTIVYRLDASTPLVNHGVSSAAATTLSSGGEDVLLFPQQSAPASQIDLFASDVGLASIPPEDEPLDEPEPQLIEAVRPNMTLRVLVDLAEKKELRRFERWQSHRPGTRVHVLGALRGAPEVLVRGSNDCCALDDGIYVVCENALHNHYQPAWIGLNGPGDDDRGSFGVWLDPESNWKRTGAPEWLVFGNDDPPGQPRMQYCLRRVRLTRIPCGVDTIRFPRPLGAWFLTPSDDRWGRAGRQYWMSGMSPTYDRGHAQADERWELLFATRGGTPDGMVAVRRDLLEDFVTDAAHPPGIYSFATVAADFPGQSVFSAWCDTHPEFQNVPSSEASFLARNRLDVQTFFPTLFRVAGPGSTTPDTWVLGVPCARLAVPPDLPDLQEHPSWRPPARYLDHYDHLLLRFWVAQDPAVFFEDGAGRSADREILGPHARAAAVGIEVVEWNGRVLGFVVDHGGRILAYDLAALLQVGEEPALLDTWETPDCPSDDVVNPIRVAFVDHARWTSDGEPREALYVYAGVQRVGVQILEWNDAAETLEPVKVIETPGETGWVARRVDGDGAATMLVGDGWGVRLYGYSD